MSTSQLLIHEFTWLGKMINWLSILFVVRSGIELIVMVTAQEYNQMLSLVMKVGVAIRKKRNYTKLSSSRRPETVSL